MRIFAGVPLGAASNDSEVVDDNFGEFGGYFFGNARDKTSNITWRYATPCWHVINYREWLFHVKIRFRSAKLSHAYLCVS